jgi:hypothetical protein
MTAAAEKSRIALQQIGIDGALVSKLEHFRIGIVTGVNATVAAGKLLSEALGDVLGRFWRNIDATGPVAEVFVAAANAAADSCHEEICARLNWLPPYDVQIVIGAPNFPANATTTIHVGANGWDVFLGNESASLGNDPNPVGPTAAAAIAAAELFRIAFAESLGEKAKRLPNDYHWCVINSECILSTTPLTFQRVPFIGVGAVMHGLLWVLERWPAEICGNIELVDPDSYSDSNGQRYAGMNLKNIGQKKVDQVRERLGICQPGLGVKAIPLSSNTYFEKYRSDGRTDLVVVGVDSKEQRRQLGLKLPRRVVNMWTDHAVGGVERHGIGDGWPCLCCVYPEDESAAFDEVGQIFQETGIRPTRVRLLLDTEAVLIDQDIRELAAKIPGIQAELFLGQPLRAVRAQLCAIERISLPNSADVDVPLAFVSLLVGVMGFVELIKEQFLDSEPYHWQANGLKYPLPTCWYPSSPKPDCYLCSDEIALSLMDHRFTK